MNVLEAFSYLALKGCPNLQKWLHGLFSIPEGGLPALIPCVNSKILSQLRGYEYTTKKKRMFPERNHGAHLPGVSPSGTLIRIHKNECEVRGIAQRVRCLPPGLKTRVWFLWPHRMGGENWLLQVAFRPHICASPAPAYIINECRRKRYFLSSCTSLKQTKKGLRLPGGTDAYSLSVSRVKTEGLPLHHWVLFPKGMELLKWTVFSFLPGPSLYAQCSLLSRMN